MELPAADEYAADVRLVAVSTDDELHVRIIGNRQRHAAVLALARAIAFSSSSITTAMWVELCEVDPGDYRH